MAEETFKGIARRGVSHQYSPRLFAFEHTPTTHERRPENLLIFVGGLSDGLHTVPYTSDIASNLSPSWTIAQVILSSSYDGWGTSSLQQDVEELSKCVAYFRTIKDGKIVLMGHSTGCQDAMEYLTGPGHETRSPIDGAIIQAPASDRESLVVMVGPDVYKKGCETATAMIESGNGEAILPACFSPSPAPVTARRWLSLASPNHDGDDDYFSSDLTDEQLMKTFGSLPRSSPLCILYSGSDEYVAETIDKEALVERWIDIVNRGNGKVDELNSAVIKGANHNVSGNAESLEDLVERVVGFLGGIAR
ncbi:uncharacterized protein BP5553_02129 [Venustampulla echinocandica]|uniref:Uncharacterized protein n=1 Tax=Venustampulla echinocandica TaxID=2656787 RepID=A0A370U2Z5_9HELO|nr:uncharacterized protein BP5553_02129 [Venustampulla echinocandica]RDL42150.1 hypothetical protein BP5553_02129 [Venustampulla echinocandica]